VCLFTPTLDYLCIREEYAYSYSSTNTCVAVSTAVQRTNNYCTSYVVSIQYALCIIRLVILFKIYIYIYIYIYNIRGWDMHTTLVDRVPVLYELVHCSITLYAYHIIMHSARS
jgi:hypothetical protein